MTKKYQITKYLDSEEACKEPYDILDNAGIPCIIDDKKYADGSTKYAVYRTDGFKPSARKDGVQVCGKVLSYGSIAGTRGRKAND